MTEFPPANFFQSQLSTAYVDFENTLLLHSRTPGRLDQIKEELDKILSEVTEQGIFRYVPDEDSRRTMREGALNAAKDFWVKKLDESGLPFNEADFGRQRITEITQRLEELTKSPENP